MTELESQDLSGLTNEIEKLDRTACLELWRAAFDRSPPKHLSQPFMKKVLIWDAQTKLLGSVRNEARKSMNPDLFKAHAEAGKVIERMIVASKAIGKKREKVAS